MRLTRPRAVLLVAATVFGMAMVAAPAASASILYCEPGEYYTVTKHSSTFVEVDQASLINKRAGAATLTAEVGEQHTSTRSYTGTISASVEAGFWIFAKASASATGSKTISTSSTMSSSYTATVRVPGHSTRTISFGFGRYNQYIERYHLYNKGKTACGMAVDHAGWVRAPYQKTFVVS